MKIKDVVRAKTIPSSPGAIQSLYDTRYSIIVCNICASFCCFILFYCSSTFNFKRFSSISASVVVANLLQPLLSIVLLLLIINTLNTQHDLIIVLGHPVNQGEACL